MMQKRHLRRRIAFGLMTAITAMSIFAAAQNKKAQPSTTKTSTAPAKKGTTKPAASSTAKPSATADEPSAESPKDAGPSDRAPTTAAASGAGAKGSVVEQKTLDGGSRVFRFGEVEVEGRLKSPQIVYFLRRVRAEFAAGDLGHRSFMRELGETRNEPAFE